MKKQRYMPAKQLDYLNWHDALKVAVTGSTPGVAPGDLTSVSAYP